MLSEQRSCDFLSALGSDPQEVGGIGEFGQCEVELLIIGGWKFRPGVHRGAEACIGECGTLHCDYEQIFAPKLVV